MMKASYPSPEPQVVAGNTGPFYNTSTQDSHLSTRDAQALQLSNVDPAIAPAARNTGESHGRFVYDPSAPPTLPDSRLEQQIEQNASDVRNADSTLSAKLQEALTPDTSKRKQAKASQACDDCRRKKIKCDATFTTMQANEPCSSCRKLNIYCQFSRQPLKRGPDKGYIKELEEKISMLEQRLGSFDDHSRHGGQRRRVDEEDFNPQQDTDGALKRKLLSSGADAETSIASHRSPEARGILRQSSVSHAIEVVPPPAAVMARSSNSRDDLDVVHEHQRGTMRQGNQDSRVAAAQVINGKSSPVLGTQHASDPPLEGYYRSVHQTLPILPHTEARLEARLSECSSKLRKAFRACFTSFANTTSSSSRLSRVNDTPLAFKNASSLILGDDFADDFTSTASLTPTLVQIQALLLMAIASASSPQDQVLHLSRAAILAERHGLHAPVPRSNLSTSDPDSDDHLSRRLYWILFILTRLNGVTTACRPPLPSSTISSSHTKLQLEDQIILGEETYHLVRCAHIIEHVVLLHLDKEATVPQSSPGAKVFGTILMGELERFRESVESVLLGAPNLLHLSYWYIRMLITCATSPNSRGELVDAALKTAEIMSSKFVAVSPLHDYFRATAHVILRHSLGDEDVRENAKAGLRLLDGGLENGGSSVEPLTDLVANVARDWMVAQG